ncbi:MULTISPECIES: PAS domain-containing sensor histidine kinase [unclassified Microbacterium]|uniref:sensor histidine kinase n=1 Tax=unclassified Microbacterium TaxID=2609290 RepID=UPI00214BF2A9|nr:MULTISPECIES: PAS domain-containing sensor histidine kinase [unclassified Microbacterium]MCR2808871.1 PAS domain-containing sensor histidine kinase [Microbacterium sp. zg.B185]WIM18711.1 ATP-binding protein [Microbacterium sp. zg-B185]
MRAPGLPRSDARTRSIWLWQVALAASVVLVTIVVVAVPSIMFADAAYWAGVLLIVATTIAALFTPWTRIGTRWVVLVPFMDIVGIGLLALNSELRLGYLWVFPIAWIATFYRLKWLIGALAAVTALLILDSVATAGGPLNTLRLVIVLLCLSFIGMTFHVAAQQTGAFRRLLSRQASRLGLALERVEMQRQRATETLDGLDIAVARISDQGEMVAANRAYAELYGLDPDDLTRPGRAVEYATLRGEPLDAESRPLARAARGEGIDEERVWLFDVEGRWRALDVSTRALSGANDEGPSTLLVLRDMTALLEAKRERESLALTVSHELRNPITAVLGHTDLLLERTDLPADARRNLAEIEAASERVLRLASTVLQKRPGAQERADAHAEFDAAAVVEASVTSFRPTATARGVELSAPDTNPLPLVGDAFRLRQAIDNVVGNAVKYTPASGTVLVRTSRSADAVRIEVADTGVGMSREDVDTMFEPYHRSATARASSVPGTGLGMGIARQIVEAHSGTISVQSGLGRGTTVAISIPLPGRAAEL